MRLLIQGLREGEEPEKEKQTSHEADNRAGFFFLVIIIFFYQFARIHGLLEPLAKLRA